MPKKYWFYILPLMVLFLAAGGILILDATAVEKDGGALAQVSAGDILIPEAAALEEDEGSWAQFSAGSILIPEAAALEEDDVFPPQVSAAVSLTAVGDVMLGRNVGKAIEKQGYNYPFSALDGYMAKADITFGNLESPLSTGGKKLYGKSVVLRGDPKMALVLAEQGGPEADHRGQGREGKTDKRRLSIDLPIILGRSRQADLKIAHSLISRKHCALLCRDGVVILRDLGSLNGTFVRGEKVAGDVRLLPNDEFSIGPVTFQVQYGSPQKSASAPTASGQPETVVAGQATLEAIRGPDFPMLQGLFLLFSVSVIVANLINAAEALGDRQDGIIEVTTSRDKEATRVTVCIADNGPGMTEEVKNRLFDPFFTTKQKTGGMGLGLSVAYGIIKDHQGWIDVDTKLGEGTTLQYHFPAARSKA
mgnify:CR=1 FL=1